MSLSGIHFVPSQQVRWGRKVDRFESGFCTYLYSFLQYNPLYSRGLLYCTSSRFLKFSVGLDSTFYTGVSG